MERLTAIVPRLADENEGSRTAAGQVFYNVAKREKVDLRDVLIIEKVSDSYEQTVERFNRAVQMVKLPEIERMSYLEQKVSDQEVDLRVLQTALKAAQKRNRELEKEKGAIEKSIGRHMKKLAKRERMGLKLIKVAMTDNVSRAMSGRMQWDEFEAACEKKVGPNWREILADNDMDVSEFRGKVPMWMRVLVRSNSIDKLKPLSLGVE